MAVTCGEYCRPQCGTNPEEALKHWDRAVSEESSRQTDRFHEKVVQVGTMRKENVGTWMTNLEHVELQSRQSWVFCWTQCGQRLEKRGHTGSSQLHRGHRVCPVCITMKYGFAHERVRRSCRNTHRFAAPSSTQCGPLSSTNFQCCLCPTGPSRKRGLHKSS